LCVCMVFELDI